MKRTVGTVKSKPLEYSINKVRLLYFYIRKDSVVYGDEKKWIGWRGTWYTNNTVDPQICGGHIPRVPANCEKPCISAIIRKMHIIAYSYNLNPNCAVSSNY